MRRYWMHRGKVRGKIKIGWNRHRVRHTGGTRRNHEAQGDEGYCDCILLNAPMGKSVSKAYLWFPKTRTTDETANEHTNLVSHPFGF